MIVKLTTELKLLDFMVCCHKHNLIDKEIDPVITTYMIMYPELRIDHNTIHPMYTDSISRPVGENDSVSIIFDARRSVYDCRFRIVGVYDSVIIADIGFCIERLGRAHRCINIVRERMGKEKLSNDIILKLKKIKLKLLRLEGVPRKKYERGKIWKS